MNQFMVFKISDSQSIVIKNICSEGNHIYRYDPVEILFKNESLEYLISENDYLMPMIERFYYYVQDAIANKLPLEEYINADLGYSWNQNLHNTDIKTHEELKNEENWKGTRYLMWGGNEFDTWLYNQNNKIYLEITPGYPWHFIDPAGDEKFIPYDEWIKSYKPLFIIEIDKVTAQQWFDRAGRIIQEIEKADSQYLHSSK